MLAQTGQLANHMFSRAGPTCAGSSAWLPPVVIARHCQKDDCPLSITPNEHTQHRPRIPGLEQMPAEALRSPRCRPKASLPTIAPTARGAVQQIQNRPPHDARPRLSAWGKQDCYYLVCCIMRTDLKCPIATTPLLHMAQVLAKSNRLARRYVSLIQYIPSMQVETEQGTQPMPWKIQPAGRYATDCAERTSSAKNTIAVVSQHLRSG